MARRIPRELHLLLEWAELAAEEEDLSEAAAGLLGETLALLLDKEPFLLGGSGGDFRDVALIPESLRG